MQFYILPNTVKHKFGDPIPRQTRICLVGAKGERVAFQAILPQAFPCVKLTADGTWKTQTIQAGMMPTHSSLPVTS